MTQAPQTSFPHVSGFDSLNGLIKGAPVIERRLSDLCGYFADKQAYAAALALGDPRLYTVANVEPAQGDGALHCSITRMLPGRVGDEYYFTKGHYHAWRAAAEYYVGLSGQGLILLEDERTGECWQLPLTPHGAAYIPGYAAHRTVNVGDEPLVFLGIYPAQAGHDYGAIVERNFRHVVVEVGGRPVQMERVRYLETTGSKFKP
jgi:glucose-6-phosphate isomerase